MSLDQQIVTKISTPVKNELFGYAEKLEADPSALIRMAVMEMLPVWRAAADQKIAEGKVQATPVTQEQLEAELRSIVRAAGAHRAITLHYSDLFDARSKAIWVLLSQIWGQPEHYLDEPPEDRKLKKRLGLLAEEYKDGLPDTLVTAMRQTAAEALQELKASRPKTKPKP